MTWVRTYEQDGDYIESLDGVEWADAPLPYPWHKCTPQTRGWFGLNYTERCACGATRLDGRHGHWMEKNQTRKAREKARAEAKLPRVQVTCRICGKSYEAADGTAKASERLCTDCWTTRFIAEYGARPGA